MNNDLELLFVLWLISSSLTLCYIGTELTKIRTILKIKTLK